MLRNSKILFPKITKKNLKHTLKLHVCTGQYSTSPFNSVHMSGKSLPFFVKHVFFFFWWDGKIIIDTECGEQLNETA